MLKLVDSGVPGLDSALGGGFYRPGSVLLVGDEGVGKSTFALQSLVFGVRNHEKGLYVAPLSETMDVALSYLRKMGFFDDALMKKGDLTVIELSDVINNPEVDIVEMLIETVEKAKFERVVIDDVSQYAAILKQDYGRFLVTIASTLMKKGCLLYFVTAQPDDVLTSIADAIILMDLDDRRTVRIIKMRGSKHAAAPLPIELSEMGIMVLPEAPK